jgi:predicted ABC-type ATPase
MPDMFVFAGCNGAGKSSLVEELQIEYEQLINPDNFAREINPLEPRKADLSAGKLAIEAIRKCLDERKSFAVETTLSGKYILNQMAAAKQRGYQVHFYYIGLRDVQLHIDRVRTRVLEGGHHVETEDIIRRYDLSLANLKYGVELADTVVILDNTKDEYEVLLEMKDGQEIYRANYWPAWLIDALKNK